ncbi:MAG: ATP phosphoribosyltransferase [Rhizobiales bacterium]|nr:ATP phosphoribosyltransferase [Hyphomicrobiales bacterium]
MSVLTLAIPSKGRLMEAAAERLARAGLAIERLGAKRGYRGRLAGLDTVEVAFLSASEIAQKLKDGKVDLGITGADLLHETIAPGDPSTKILLGLGFGPANVVVAVPECWLDVASMADLDEVSESFYERHGRRLRVATKYHNLTRRFFAEKGVTGYRIVESLGATEGAPAAGLAEIIVDITTTGSTLAANHLKILDDGVILKSTAVFAATRAASTDPRAARIAAALESANPT